MSTDTARSCVNCPSFGTVADSVKFFNKSIGGPVCLRYAKPLSRPGMNPRAERRLAEVTASGCDSYGKPRPGTPERVELQVAFPDTMATDTESIPANDAARCSSCNSCSNLVRETVVADQFGWPLSLCAAKGKLLLPSRFTVEARSCEFKRWGTPRQELGGITLLPEFQDDFGSTAIDPIKAYFKNKDNFVDPTEYPTDVPVSPEDEARGIRAIRKISDPSGHGDDLYLPVYDLERYPAELRDLVPRTGDDEHPELYLDHQGLTYAVAAMWTQLDETPAFWGEAGTGKTEFYRYMAWLMVLPFWRISITASTELDDLAGKMLFDPERGTYFQYGRLPRAWQSPGVIVIDEPNTGPPDVWQFLRPLTDNSKQLAMDMAAGERISRHADSYLGMAMNPSWDPKNVGTTQIGDADANRLMHFSIGLPPEKLEREIIGSRVRLDGWEPPEKMLDVIMSVAQSLRMLIENQTLAGISWGLRPQIKVTRALRFFSPVMAYRMAIADSLDPDQREAVLDQVRQHVDEDNLPWR